MTQNEHNIIAGIILIIIYQIIYHKVLKHHPVAKKTQKSFQKFLENIFRANL